MKSTSPIEFDSMIPRFSAFDFEWIDPHEIRDLKRLGREEAFILPVSKVLTRKLSFAVDFSISEPANFISTDDNWSKPSNHGKQMLAKLQFVLDFNNRMSQRLVRPIRLIVAQDNTSYKANERHIP